LEFGVAYQASIEELRIAGEDFQRESAIPMRFDTAELSRVLLDKGCQKLEKMNWNGKRCRGWEGVRLVGQETG